jgi:hypothetical protein
MSNATKVSRPSAAESWTRIGLFTLPVYGALLAATTGTPQPDQTRDPMGWAQFVSTPDYLAQHVLTNVVSPPLVVLGTVALGALLAGSRASRSALTGMVISVVGHVLLMVPGAISTFATPAIGGAYLDGNTDVMTLRFGDTLTLTFLLALLLTVAGSVTLGVAVWRSRVLPRWTGALWAVAAVVFYLAGAALGMATTGASLPTQPVGGVLMAVSGAAIAWAGVHHVSASSVNRLSTGVAVDRAEDAPSTR